MNDSGDLLDRTRAADREVDIDARPVHPLDEQCCRMIQRRFVGAGSRAADGNSRLYGVEVWR
jgi:hypothetical protein